MAFQFKRDRGDHITLILAGDIDLEVTPTIKKQLSSQLDDATSLTIDASNISYLDSSGVSILVIAMQSSKQNLNSMAIVPLLAAVLPSTVDGPPWKRSRDKVRCA